MIETISGVRIGSVDPLCQVFVKHMNMVDGGVNSQYIKYFIDFSSHTRPSQNYR